MYILYESYNDETKYIKELEYNTKIIGLYNDKDKAIKKLNEIVNNTITLEDGTNEWFTKEVFVEDKQVVSAYQVFNKGIEEYEESYVIILLEMEVIDNEQL